MAFIPSFQNEGWGFYFMKITFVIGGARSGKSSFALKKASDIRGQKMFIATAEALDDEMKDRIMKHRIERDSEWETCEEPIQISEALLKIKDKYGTAVLDCLTVWLSNLLAREQIAGPPQETVHEAVRKFLDTLGNPGNLDLFIISNEVGLGIVPNNKLARQFRDLAGELNQKIAEIADEVYLVTAGIPVKIK